MASTPAQLMAVYSNQSQLSNLFESDKLGIYAAKSYLTLDGVTDDYTALYTLINTTINGANAEIWIKNGTAKIGSNITIPSNIKLVFLHGGKLKPKSGVTITGSNTKIVAGLYNQIFDLSDGGTLGGVWNVKESSPYWFGALGNGTNDLTAFQNTLNFSSLSGGNVVVPFPSTYFLINGAVTIPDNTNIYGNGYNSVIKITGTNSWFRHTGTYSSNVTIKNLRMYGQSSKTGAVSYNWGVRGTFKNCTIKNCWFTNFGREGVEFIGQDSDNCKVLNCVFNDNRGSGIAVTWGKNFTIQNNKVYSNGYWGIRFEADTTSNNIIDTNIFDNEVYSNAFHGISIYVGSGTTEWKTTIRGNRSYSNGQCGIHTETQKNVIIDGNKCFENNWEGIYSFGQFVIITKNQCWNNAKNMTGNTLVYKQSAGIVCSSDNEYYIVTDNICFDNQTGVETQTYGIVVRNASAIKRNNNTLSYYTTTPNASNDLLKVGAFEAAQTTWNEKLTNSASKSYVAGETNNCLRTVGAIGGDGIYYLALKVKTGVKYKLVGRAKKAPTASLWYVYIQYIYDWSAELFSNSIAYGTGTSTDWEDCIITFTSETPLIAIGFYAQANQYNYYDEFYLIEI